MTVYWRESPSSELIVFCTLCEEIDARSRPSSLTSTGTFPAICAMSECRNVLFALHNYTKQVLRTTRKGYLYRKALLTLLISFSGCITPISLLTPIIDTSTVSGRSAAFSWSRSIKPLVCTGR
jgi:hypothetical protein